MDNSDDKKEYTAQQIINNYLAESLARQINRLFNDDALRMLYVMLEDEEDDEEEDEVVEDDEEEEDI